MQGITTMECGMATKLILFNCVYGFFIDALVFCDDVKQVYGSYGRFVDLL